MQKIACLLLATAGFVRAADYLVVVPESAADEWQKVGLELADAHSGKVERVKATPDTWLDLLRRERPRFLAVVGPPSGFDARFVRTLNRVSRQIDDDPFADIRWGLVTAATPEAARRIVLTRQPLVIERALTTTGIDLGLVKSGLTLSDGAKGDYTVKEPGQEPAKKKWDKQADPGGTVGFFEKAWNETRPQLLVTSSHATQFNLEMPFGLGLIASHGGKFHVLTRQKLPEFAQFLGGAMFTGDPAKLGHWLEEQHLPVLAPSTEPKVWVAAGNCLIGDARKTTDSMVVSALTDGGVTQFVGYVVPTWFGRAGWGTLGLWQQSRGGLTLSEAFFLNDHRVIEETRSRFPGALAVTFDAEDIESCLRTDRQFNDALGRLQATGVKVEKDTLGLIHDRDVLALWGDPAWEARFDPAAKPHALFPTWKDTTDGLELQLTAQADFEGDLPLCLPRRFEKTPAVTAPDGLEVVAADDFVLVKKFTLKKGESRSISLKKGN